MASPTANKLRIKEGFTLLTVNAPEDFKKNIGPLPAGVKITAASGQYKQVHWFVVNKAQMEEQLNKVMKLVKDEVVLWIYYPKGSSRLQTDLTRDKGWDKLLKHGELTWISLISFDETWSAFGSRLKTQSDKNKEKQSQERPIFNYVDPKTKSVRLPDDLAKALRKNRKSWDFFDSLSFTNKKEYIEWIITAKREETRTERLQGTLDRLAKGWKNPRNL